MDPQDFWTTVVAAALVLVAELPSVLPAEPGLADSYGAMRVLLIIGPVGMILLAVLGRLLSKSRSDRDEH